MADMGRIMALAKHLRYEVLGENFNQGTWGPSWALFYNCDVDTFRACLSSDSAACIAGHAVSLFGSSETVKDKTAMERSDIASLGRQLLDLTHDQATLVFVPCLNIKLKYVTKEQAATTLENFAKTGIINWAVNGSLYEEDYGEGDEVDVEVDEDEE